MAGWNVGREPYCFIIGGYPWGRAISENDVSPMSISAEVDRVGKKAARR
jgi:hypothetical protein